MTSLSPDEFVEQHLALAYWVVRRRIRTAGARVDPAQIESDGLLGLVRAAQTWRPGAGASSATWVRSCVERAVTDGLRRSHGETRDGHLSARARARHVPYDVLLDADLPAHHDDHDSTLSQLDLARAMACLPERHRRMVVDYYWRGHTLTEVGRAWGVNESRACQILGEARRTLRKAMSDPDEEAPHLRLVRWWGAFVRAGVGHCRIG